MNNRIHLHGRLFIVERPDVKTKCNQHLKIPMIDTPKMIWIHQVQNLNIPLDYSDDIDHGSFDYNHYGKSVFRP